MDQRREEGKEGGREGVEGGASPAPSTSLMERVLRHPSMVNDPTTQVRPPFPPSIPPSLPIFLSHSKPSLLPSLPAGRRLPFPQCLGNSSRPRRCHGGSSWRHQAAFPSTAGRPSVPPSLPPSLILLLPPLLSIYFTSLLPASYVPSTKRGKHSPPSLPASLPASLPPSLPQGLLRLVLARESCPLYGERQWGLGMQIGEEGVGEGGSEGGKVGKGKRCKCLLLLTYPPAHPPTLPPSRFSLGPRS